ncbi:SDR family oxidoreductase [Alteromonas lipolytica]|uniref:NAD-dependent dehydratase n=1 Tax=Alteromonas lipolytica TaxID=1856405 RepID=A0A1E8F8B2_9ALTE|nr:SDR family oxidoreductase [Alteromonas lipolytica]OFI32152.1 NAD-dependent dehydratase [Alteromonas lipolytica]GGF83462.1 NAD-dependent dehydratase [Alteromonas lipolytica]
MSRIFFVGATGKVGHRLLPQLIAQGHKVTALHRKPEQAEKLAAQGATPVQGDMMELTGSDYETLLKGHDTIIFSAGAAGSGKERTGKIDGETPPLLAKIGLEVGVKRFYLVSAFPESARNDNLGEGFEYYMKVKKEADAKLVKSALDWVIVRPGTLLDEEADNKVSLDYALTYGKVKRGNVANTLAALIAQPAITRQILELTDGDEAITDAIGRITTA